MLKKFIERPVLSTVISIIITVLGILGVLNLPVTQYPNIAPPTVQVTASYPGANAETILESVIIPIEEQINGVEGMTTLPLVRVIMVVRVLQPILNKVTTQILQQ